MNSVAIDCLGPTSSRERNEVHKLRCHADCLSHAQVAPTHAASWCPVAGRRAARYDQHARGASADACRELPAVDFTTALPFRRRSLVCGGAVPPSARALGLDASSSAAYRVGTAWYPLGTAWYRTLITWYRLVPLGTHLVPTWYRLVTARDSLGTAGYRLVPT
jgi:hypothetical protein